MFHDRGHATDLDSGILAFINTTHYVSQYVSPAGALLGSLGQLSLPSFRLNRVPAYWLGLSWGMLTCVGWQVTL